MKKVLNQLKNGLFLILIIITLSFISCGIEPIDNYKNCIVYGKDDNSIIIKYIKYIKSDSIKYDFKRVYVLEYDYNKYNVGDTIK